MRERRRFAWLRLFLLVVPLLALASWLVLGGLSGSFGPDADPGASAPLLPTFRLSGFPPPDADYSPERMHERVNGAADALRARGCNRLLYWRTEEPPAELELLVFDAEEGAAGVLARDVGPERMPGPGDEASVGAGAIFFRRGRYYARLLSAPGAAPDPEALLRLAARVDTGLTATLAGGSR